MKYIYKKNNNYKKYTKTKVPPNRKSVRFIIQLINNKNFNLF